MISVVKEDECFMRLEGNTNPLRDHFRFQIPNAKFHPKVRNGFWDGYINMIQAGNRLYRGLLPKLAEVCGFLEIPLEIDPDLIDIDDSVDVSALARGCIYEPKDYQAKAVGVALREKRQVIVSPTSSGKSFIMYLIAKHVIKTGKVLVIVPTIGLTGQLKEEFEDYDPNVDQRIYEISAGVEKTDDIDADIVISTWQSIMRMPEEFFDQFTGILVDEVHEASKIVDKKLVIVSILEKCRNATYRLGFTGSLESDKVDRLVLEGVFGPITEVVTTHELMARGDIAQSKIVCLVLKYPEADRKSLKAVKKGLDGTKAFQAEVKFLQEHKKRTSFLGNLVKSQKENVLLLFDKVNYGKNLSNSIDKETHLVYGDTSKTQRDQLRKLCELKSGIAIVASMGTFKRGVNIKNLHIIVRECLIKEPNTVKQFIGRGLRLHSSKDHLTYYDIVDDLTVDGNPNFAMKQFDQRLELYYKERHPTKIIQVEL